MKKLTAADLSPLEHYSLERAALRVRLIGHRRGRQLAVGEHCTWSFEDRETIRYQVQEMLRAERIFEAAAIDEELAVYNPLIPDGTNLKATLLLEYADPAERLLRLTALRGVERCCWMQVSGHGRVLAVADEDLERESETKTSAVHFLRFEFTAEAISALKAGASFAAGVDHPDYRVDVDPIPAQLGRALLADFD